MNKIKFIATCMVSFLVAITLGSTACKKEPNNNGSSGEIVDQIDEGTISLSIKRIEIDIDEEYVLTAITTPSNATVVWSVAEPSVAVVEDGRVKGIANGQTVVYASTGDYIKATCIVVVKQKLISAYAVRLSQEETQIAVGDILTMSAIVKFGEMDVTKPKLTWTSSDQSIATIESNGVITALKKGTTFIIAEYTAVDGTKAKAQCVLNVI